MIYCIYIYTIYTYAFFGVTYILYIDACGRTETNNMCGFIGFTGYTDDREDVIRRMADRIAHRGPDMEGYHISEDGKEPITDRKSTRLNSSH